MAFDAFKFAEESARLAFAAKPDRAVLHWPHPDYRTKAACGKTCIGDDRFGNPPTCPDCVKQKATWDADDAETRQLLGIH